MNNSFTAEQVIRFYLGEKLFASKPISNGGKARFYVSGNWVSGTTVIYFSVQEFRGGIVETVETTQDFDRALELYRKLN